MKKVLALLLVLILAISLVGCQSAEETIETPTPKVEEPETTEIIDMPFEVAIEVDQSALDVIESSMAERSFKFMKSETPGVYYVAVFAGEKPSTGYDIKVDKIEIIDGKLVVTAVESSPNPEAMNASTLTYPMHVVIVRDIDENIDVEVIVDEVTVEVIDGAYAGRVDNNSIEVMVGEESLVLRLTYLSVQQIDALELQTDETVRVEAYVDAKDQIILKSIERIE